MLLPALFALLPQISTGEGEGPRWLTDPAEAFASAEASGRPLVIVFR